MSETPFPELWLRNAAGQVTACPCLALNIYLDETDREQILAFHERAFEALRPHLTHYLAERMQQPAKLTPRALSMVPTWLRRPKQGHDYQMRMWGGEVMDVSPWSIEILYTHIPFNEARRARYPAFLAGMEQSSKHGPPEIPGTVLRVTVPVDSELAQPSLWLDWVMGFEVLQKGWFMSAESGYSMTTRGDIDDQAFLRAACSRYPGLDWFHPKQVKVLRRYEPSTQGMLFQVKRAAWLTCLHEGALALLGGEPALRASIAGEPAIALHPLAHGLGIVAGPRPELGNLAQQDIPALQRRVARLLKPVQLTTVPLAYEEEFVAHYLQMYDAPEAPT